MYLLRFNTQIIHVCPKDWFEQNFGVVIRTPHYLSPEIVNNEARLLFCYLFLELISRCWTTKDHTRWVMIPGKDCQTPTFLARFLTVF